METVKNIAAIIGVILSAASLITLCSKTFRSFLKKLFKKYGNEDEVSQSIADIKTMLEQHIAEENEIKDNHKTMNEITIEFIKTQCRNNIKTIFYKYKDSKRLPLYEKKTLMNIEDLYVKKLKGNSFAALLIEEMSNWEIDYDDAHPDEEDNI